MSEAKELDKLLELVCDDVAEKHYNLSIQAIDTMTAYVPTWHARTPLGPPSANRLDSPNLMPQVVSQAR